jgi:hypothetical protein
MFTLMAAPVALRALAALEVTATTQVAAMVVHYKAAPYKVTHMVAVVAADITAAGPARMVTAILWQEVVAALVMLTEPYY